MLYQELSAGAILQIKPSTNDDFSGCFIIFHECTVKHVIGYFHFPSLTPDGFISIEVERKWEDVEYVGEAFWVTQREKKENDRIVLFKSEKQKKVEEI